MCVVSMAGYLFCFASESAIAITVTANSAPNLPVEKFHRTKCKTRLRPYKVEAELRSSGVSLNVYVQSGVYELYRMFIAVGT